MIPTVHHLRNSLRRPAYELEDRVALCDIPDVPLKGDVASILWLVVGAIFEETQAVFEVELGP